MTFDVATVLLQALVPAPAYGAQLIAKIRDRTQGRLSPSSGSVYAVLRELEKAEHVTSSLGEKVAARGGRARRYYKLTPKGRAQARKDREMVLRIFAGTG